MIVNSLLLLAYAVVFVSGHSQGNENKCDSRRRTGRRSMGKPCLCGILDASSSKRVVGGIPATAVYPWMAALRYKYQNGSIEYFCGASVITDRYLITAAHCVSTYEEERRRMDNMDEKLDTELQVVLGTNNLVELKNAKIFNVADVITHGDYDPETYDSDIALVEVAKKFNFQKDRIKPICIISKGFTYGGKYGTVVGWGYTSDHFLNKETAKTSSKLLEIKIPIIDTQSCRSKTDWRAYEVTDNMICAAGSGRDACQGDSGGPLMLRYEGNKKHFHLIGVVSFGNYCGKISQPGLYTKVENFFDWIVQTLVDKQTYTCSLKTS